MCRFMVGVGFRVLRCAGFHHVLAAIRRTIMALRWSVRSCGCRQAAHEAMSCPAQCAPSTPRPPRMQPRWGRSCPQCLTQGRRSRANLGLNAANALRLVGPARPFLRTPHVPPAARGRGHRSAMTDASKGVATGFPRVTSASRRVTLDTPGVTLDSRRVDLGGPVVAVSTFSKILDTPRLLMAGRLRVAAMVRTFFRVHRVVVADRAGAASGRRRRRRGGVPFLGTVSPGVSISTRRMRIVTPGVSIALDRQDTATRLMRVVTRRERIVAPGVSIA